ncbi:MAG: SPOR domain-containing protein [Bacteroidota bacterium]|nr:SPOR domain-containing protein [Bacteroidota bacterium]
MMAELRPEERTGFEPEHDTETFLLERQPYPGSLPWQPVEGEEREGELTPLPSEVLSDEPVITAEEVLRLDEELLRLLQDELRRPRKLQRNLSPTKTESEILLQKQQSASGEAEISLEEFPPHPSAVWEERGAVNVPPTPEQPPTTYNRRPKRTFLPELTLGVLVAAGLVLLWYWGVYKGMQHGQGNEGERLAEIMERAPLRGAGQVEPIWIESERLVAQLPLLQVHQQQQPTTLPQTFPSPTSSAASTGYPSSPSATQLFAVQVYASQLQEDAVQLAEHLQRLGLPNVTVVPAQIRGQTWWRVRFGAYGTRLQAEQAAIRAGFRNAWIVRLQ